MLSGHEIEEPETEDVIECQWGAPTVDTQEQQESVLDQVPNTVQTIIMKDENGQPIEIHLISSDPANPSADQLQFDLLQAFEMQGGNVDDTLAALIWNCVIYY